MNIWETIKSYSNNFNPFLADSENISVPDTSVSDDFIEESNSSNTNNFLNNAASFVSQGMRYAIDHPLQALTYMLALQTTGVSAMSCDPNQIPISTTEVSGAIIGNINLPMIGTGGIRQPLDVFVSNEVAYVPNGSFLHVFNISDINNPVLLNSISSFDELLTGSPEATFVANDLTYVATSGRDPSRPGGLRILNFTDPTSPILLGNYTYPSAGVGFQTPIHVSNNIAYLNHGPFGSFVQSFNVTDPATPSFLSSFQVFSSSAEVFVFNNTAYMLEQGSGLRIFNITNPEMPELLGSFNASSTKLYVTDGYAYINNRGTDPITGSTTDELFILDIENLTTPSLLGRYSFPNGILNDFAVLNDVAYTNVGNFQFINVSVPQEPSYLGEIFPTFVQGGAVDLGFSFSGSKVRVFDGLAYATFNTFDEAGVRIIQLDYTPMLTTNQIEVVCGQNTLLNSSHLAATDQDHDDNELTFIIEFTTSNFIFRNASTNLPITCFTQQQLQNSEIIFSDDCSFGIGIPEISVTDGLIRSPSVDIQVNRIFPMTTESSTSTATT